MAKASEQLNIWFAVGAVILVVILLIVLLPAKSTEESTLIEKEKLFVNEPEAVTGEPVKEGIVYSESDLCEDYVFEQGQSMKLDNHTVELIKIGKVSARVSINGKEVIISEGDSVFENGLRIEFKENDLIYFAEDDEDNRVEFRIGCRTDVDPSEKHILETIMKRGENICDALIKQCESEFGTE